MDTVAVMALVIVFIIVLGIVGPVVLLALLFRVLGKGSRAGGLTEEELRLVQEIHLGLAAMEKRVEALETILLEKMK